MNGRNRHNKYRRGVYKRRSIGTVLITAAVTLLIVFIVLTVIGNILHQQSRNRHQINNDTIDNTTNTPVFDTVNVPKINAYRVLLETSDSSVFSQRLDALKSQGATSVSIPLNDDSGTLLFKSENAALLGYNTGSKVTLSSAVESAKDGNVYISGVFKTNIFGIENKLARNIEIARLASIIAEVLESGVNDVIIVTPHLTSEHIGEVETLVSSIRRLTSKGAVGITVTDAIFKDESASATISKLNSSVDFLALDTSNFDDADAAEFVESKISSENMLYLHMYSFRLLLPYLSDEEAQASVILAAGKGGINNWQII